MELLDKNNNYINCNQHVIGDKECPACWYENYPLPCKCGGLLHADVKEFSDEWIDLEIKCDKCGESL